MDDIGKAPKNKMQLWAPINRHHQFPKLAPLVGKPASAQSHITNIRTIYHLTNSNAHAVQLFRQIYSDTVLYQQTSLDAI